jgi:hypothetical protein
MISAIIRNNNNNYMPDKIPDGFDSGSDFL